jgi:hypothetical protein
MGKTAIFTMVQNDTVFTERWVDYHAQFFDVVYVLDHDSEGDAEEVLWGIRQVTAGREHVSVLPVHNYCSYDAPWMVRIVRQFQAFLLQSYDVVAFTAVDEFLATRQGDLSGWLEIFGSSGAWATRAAGYEVVHYRDQEQPLDWHADLWLPQRKMWYPCQKYSKPVLSKFPISWTPGFSNASNMSDVLTVSDDLLLLHLHRIDYDTCLRKHRETRAREWAPADKNAGPYRHNRLEEPEALSRWMLCNADDTANYATLEPIPAVIRDLL